MDHAVAFAGAVAFTWGSYMCFDTLETRMAKTRPSRIRAAADKACDPRRDSEFSNENHDL